MTAPTTHPHSRHIPSCFWDYLECRWQCPQSTAIDPSGPTQEPISATAPTETETTCHTA